MHTKRLIGTSVFMALAIGGCASHMKEATQVPSAASDPSSLALVVKYTTLCATPSSNDSCASVSWPEVCWAGNCVENCGNDGAQSFNVCAPGGTKTEIPFEVDQTAMQRGLAKGKWQVHASSPLWKLDCAAEVGGPNARAAIDSAERECI